MAKLYILAQFNQAQNKIILSPSELRVCPGDMVRWISRLDEGEIYVAGNFVGKTGLFKKHAYPMPGVGESEPAEVTADPSGSQAAWTYTCQELLFEDAADGDSGQGIIIVDPPPIPDDNDEKSPAQQEQEVEVA